MNSTFKRMLDNETNKFNRDIMDGLARPFVDRIPEYLDSVIKSAMSTLSEDIPLVYKGYRKITPKEDFLNNINSSMSKNIVDISRNYLYKIEFGFIYDGKDFNRLIALPYVDRGGHLILSDAHYAIVPVLSEYPISPAPGEIFIRLLRDKLNVKRMDRNILVNGVKESKQIIFAKSYKLLDKVNDKVPIALYGLIKYGFYGFFKKYFNTKPIVVTDPMLKTDHLQDEYIEYTTMGVKPRNLQILNYIPHSIRIYIKKEDVNNFLEIVVSSLIYSFDMSPVFAMNITKVLGIKKEPNTYISFNNIDDESLYWLTLLGKIVFKNKFSTDRVQADMLEHIDILNGYLDIIIKEKLKEIHINVEDFFDLLMFSIENFNKLTMNQEVYSSQLKNRYIEVRYYILFDLIVGINKAFLEFKRTASKKKLNLREIDRLFSKLISTKKIFNMIKGGTNIALSPVD